MPRYKTKKEKKEEKKKNKEKIKNNDEKNNNKKIKSDDKKKKLTKEMSQEISKKLFGNILKAVAIVFYFMILNLAYSTMQHDRLVGDIEVFAGAFLVAGIIFLERAYKKDSGSIAITAIELLVISLHSLSIMHVITLFQYDFRVYLLTSSYVFSIYYVLKAIILYTKDKRDYLKSLSDISEIVKKDEPVVKEAQKRKVDEEPKKSNENKQTKVENKTQNKSTKKKKRGNKK